MTPKDNVAYAEMVHQAVFNADVQHVFDALTRDVAEWWLHLTYDTDKRPDICLEPYAGGRFFERFGSNERLYAIVTRFEPPKRLCLQGSMGMPGCTHGTIVFDIESHEGQTLLKATHQVIGVFDSELVATYRAGWALLLEKGLKAFVENVAVLRAQ